MKHPEWTEADSRTCKQIWAAYQKQHDITDRIGQTAGIDPKKWPNLVRRLNPGDRPATSG